jgi:hypothetical protein
MDLAWCGLLAVLFVATVALVAGCDRLLERR